MNDQQITCPKCQHKFPLSETFSRQIKESLKNELAAENKKKENELNEKLRIFKVKQKEENENIEKEKKKLREKSESIDRKVEKKLKEQRKNILESAKKEAEKKIKKETDLQLKDLQTQNEEKDKELELARKNELDLRKKTREIEKREKNFELEMQRKMDKEREKLINQIKKDEQEESRRKMLEKDKQINQMRKTIEELKRKSEQGSTQIQGDAQEEDLKSILKNKFPIDAVEDVPTGIKGADIIQTVNTNSGENSGIILWESKNTKKWSNDWIKKLKEDQGIVRADVCILASRVLPEGIKNFDFINGVWVCNYHFALSLASVLRLHLLEVGKVKRSLIGKDEKMEVLYKYLTGSQFKNRIENIVIAFTEMKGGLDSEKRAIQRIWSKREKEIEKVIENTSGMYGDLQGIVGRSALSKVKILELPEAQEPELEVEDKN
ncbi:MAG: DUF2130 domain-containing protein [Candidatus Nealsonbacteria bacterium]